MLYTGDLMGDTYIKLNKKLPKLEKPVLVVGLPGIGSVGKIVVEHLKKEFKAEKIATLYSNHFPHQVAMLKNGGIRLVNNRFYILKSKDKKKARDIVLLTGDVQAMTSEGQYEVNKMIVDFFKNQLKGSFIYTLGGYNISGSVAQNPRVFGNATSMPTVDKFRSKGIIFGESRGTILGSAGLVIAFAKMQGMEGICLMGETTFIDIDHRAAKAVLETLAKELGLKIDTKNLDKMIEKTAQTLKELEQQLATAVPMPTLGPGNTSGDNRTTSYIR